MTEAEHLKVSKVDNIRNFTVPFLNHKLCLRVFVGGHIVAMVTYCVAKKITTCSPMIEQFSDAMIVASCNKEWL